MYLFKRSEKTESWIHVCESIWKSHRADYHFFTEKIIIDKMNVQRWKILSIEQSKFAINTWIDRWINLYSWKIIHVYHAKNDIGDVCDLQ